VIGVTTGHRLEVFEETGAPRSSRSSARIDEWKAIAPGVVL